MSRAGRFNTALFIFLLTFAAAGARSETNFTVTTNETTAVTSSSGEMHGTVSAGTGPTGAWFEWGTTTALGSRTDVQVFTEGSAAISFAQALRTLQPHTTYYFRAVGYRSATTVAGEIRSFTTTGDASPATSLTAVTGSATSITSSSAALNGNVNPGNGSTTVWFNWGTTTSMGTRTDVQTFSGSSTVAVTQTLRNLQAHTTYYFRIEAYRSSDGAAAIGDVKTFTTSDAPATSITATTNDATNVTTAAAVLNGGASGATGPFAVWFEWGTTTALGARTEPQIFNEGRSVTLSQPLNNLRPNTTYYFRTVVYPSVAGAPNVLGEIKTFTTASDSPETLRITSVSSGEVTNNSAALRATVNTGSGGPVTGYFEWGTSSTSVSQTEPQTIAPGSASPFAHPLRNLPPRTTYYFRAVVSSGGVTVRSDIRDFTTAGENSSAFGVTTLPASAVSTASAELRGIVNLTGAAASVSFEWGPTTALSNQTAAQNLSAATSAVNFAFSLTNLQANTVYYFRAVGQNATSTVKGEVKSFMTTRVPSTVPETITEVEQGKIRSGYVVITPGTGSAAPTPTVTFGTVSHGSIQSQAGIVPTPMALDASMFVEVVPSISRKIGVAFANPGGATNAITMTLRDEDGLIVGSPVVVSVPPRHQVAKFLDELFGADSIGTGFRGSVRMQSATAFATIGLRFSGSIFSTLPVSITTVAPGDGSGALIVPQFAISGGWATQIGLVNNTSATEVGRVDIFDTDGNPMPVPLNGETRSTFTYSIPVGGTFILAPRDSNGQSPL